MMLLFIEDWPPPFTELSLACQHSMWCLKVFAWNQPVLEELTQKNAQRLDFFILSQCLSF